jgi:hypothetical protein
MATPSKFKTLSEISRRMKDKPILVGGSAVDLYSLGGFSSIDLDLVVKRKEIEPVLSEMGFKQKGKYYQRKDDFIDVVGSDIRDKRVQTVTVKGSGKIKVIGVEDLIVDRLCACKFWKSKTDCEQAEFLLKGYGKKLDRGYLEEKAEKADVIDKVKAWFAKKP